MSVVHKSQARRTETPNATMTTLASPTQGGSQLSVWRVDMGRGAAGPIHVFDTDQVWTVLGGSARIDLGDNDFNLEVGDRIIIPAGVPRRIFADPQAGLSVIACATASTRIPRPDVTAPVPASATLDGDKLLPDWIA